MTCRPESAWWFRVCELAALKLPSIEYLPYLRMLTRSDSTLKNIASMPYVTARILHNEYGNSDPLEGAKRVLEHPMAEKIMPLYTHLLSPQQLCRVVLQRDEKLTPYFARVFYEKYPRDRLWQDKIWPRLMRPCALPTETLLMLLAIETLPRPLKFPIRWIGLWPDADRVLAALLSEKGLANCRHAVMAKLRGNLRAIALAAISMAERMQGAGDAPIITRTTAVPPPEDEMEYFRIAAGYFRPFAVREAIRWGDIFLEELEYFQTAFQDYGRHARYQPATNHRVLRNGCNQCIYRAMGMIYTRLGLSPPETRNQGDLAVIFQMLSTFTFPLQEKLAGLWICTTQLTPDEISTYIRRRRNLLSKVSMDHLLYIRSRLHSEETMADRSARLRDCADALGNDSNDGPPSPKRRRLS